MSEPSPSPSSEPRLHRADPDYLQREKLHHALLTQRDLLWSEVTEKLLDRLELNLGVQVYAPAAGLGLSFPRILRRIGSHGTVLALESDPLAANECKRRLEEGGWNNVTLESRAWGLQDFRPPGYQAVVSLFHFSSEHEKSALLGHWNSLLTPGGRVGILDVHLNGLRLYPHNPHFEAIRQALCQDERPFFGGELPGLLVESGFFMEAIQPFQKAELPGEQLYDWVESLFHYEVPRLVNQGVLPKNTWDSFLSDWGQVKIDPKSVLYSPLVVAAVARRLS